MKGLNKENILELAKRKKEPKWVTDLRMRALRAWEKLEMSDWGPSLEGLDFGKIETYINPKQKMVKSWDEVPEEIRQTFEDLGIPEAEREALGGVGAQYDSEMVYFNLKKQIEAKGVVYLPMEEAVRSRRRLMDVGVRENLDGGEGDVAGGDKAERSDGGGMEVRSLVRRHFMRIVTPEDYKFAALHGAVWSGGSFLYVPKNVSVEIPLQSYYRLNAPGAGQFEHSLIIVDEGAELHFIEGCSAPKHSVANLHVGCVEVLVRKNAHLKFVVMDSWSKNMFNLSAKKALVTEGGVMEWVSGSFGSQASMLYPTTVLDGENARMTFKGISVAGEGQNLDTGVKVIHLADNTYSDMDVRSLTKDGGVSTTRSLVKVIGGVKGVRSFLDCQSLILDGGSVANTLPKVEVSSDEAEVGHEASVGQISEEEIFYLKSRGLSERKARALVVRGFTGGVASELPIEYAREMNRLIELEMEK